MENQIAAAPRPQPSAVPSEDREDIQSARDMIESLAGRLKAEKSQGDLEVEAMRSKAYGTLFDSIRKAGFDPTTLEGIAAYRAFLGTEDPDGAIVFDYVVRQLDAESTVDPVRPLPAEISGRTAREAAPRAVAAAR
jgi:hypothetical protein